MTVYFMDSSALVKNYITEPGSDHIRAIISSGDANKIMIARITPIELLSALARRRRQQSISERTARAARLLVERHVRREYQLVHLTDAVIERASDLLDDHPLRAYDAVQLASALEVSAHLTASGLKPPVFVCVDRRLLDVAINEGLSVERPV